MVRLLAVLALSAGATTAHAQPVRTVDVRLPGRGEVQRLALEDGSQVYGRVDAVRNESIGSRPLRESR
jgi:ferric-dicitrate binding protein FerR (iron transport regulator)